MNALERLQYRAKIVSDFNLYRHDIDRNVLAIFTAKILAAHDCDSVRKVLCDAMGYAWLDGIKYQLNGEKLS